MKKDEVILRMIKWINAVIMTIPFAVVWIMYYSERIASPYYAKGNYLIIFIFMILYISYGRLYEAFQVSLHPVHEMISSQGLAVIISNMIMYAVMWLLTKHLPDILPLTASFGFELLWVVIWSFAAERWYYKTIPPIKTAIIYDVRQGIQDLIDEYGLDRKFDIVRIVHINECLEDNLQALEGVENVFLSGVHSSDRNTILKYCVDKGIRVYLLPRIGDIILSGADKIHMFHLPMLRVGRYSPNPEYIVIKRLLDIVISLCALVITSPIFLITVIAIKISDPGPVFYKQCRLTKDRKKFQVLKFRSMYVDAEKDGVARLSSGKNDNRITPVGRFIRSVRIDELPQLINILQGDMSIVGPRPERPEIAGEYEKDMPEFALRLQAKAGLTGYAQVYGKYNTTAYDKLQMDLMYLANPSLIEDIKICFATVRILFMKESTEGVAVGQITAKEMNVGMQVDGTVRQKAGA